MDFSVFHVLLKCQHGRLAEFVFPEHALLFAEAMSKVNYGSFIVMNEKGEIVGQFGRDC